MSQQPERTELALRMLCAWSNIPPDKAPPEWFKHPSDANRQAWERVAQAAIDYLSPATKQAEHDPNAGRVVGNSIASAIAGMVGI